MSSLSTPYAMYSLVALSLKVDANNFVNIVENLSKEDVLVVVHLLDPQLPKCVQLNSMLHNLASVEFRRTKFLSLDLSENEIEVDRLALPMLQLYRNGDLVETIAPVHMEVIVMISPRPL